MSKSLVVIVGRAAAPSESFVRRDMEALRRRGWQVRMLATDGWAAGEEAAGRVAPRALAVAVRQALARAGMQPRQALALLRRAPLIARAAACARRADLVLAHFAWLTADVAACAALLAGRPWLCAVHARDVFTQPLRELRRRLRGAVRVVACSEAAAAAARIAAPPGCPVTRVHHGLPLDEYPFHPAARPPLEIAAVGRLEAKKGFDTLIAACTDCCARRPELRLHLVGDGTRRAALERQIASAGLRAQVVLHGWLDQAATREIVARAALCILPSRRLPNGDRDGLANVLLEAMALGTPVITTPAGAAAEIVRDGETGVLVPPDDPVRLSAAIKMLLDAPERRARLATRARDVVEADFDLRRTGALLEQELLGATLAATRTHAPAAMPASPRRL